MICVFILFIGAIFCQNVNFLSHCILFLAYPSSSLNSQWQSQRIIPIITKTENTIGILPENPLPNRGSKWREWIPSFWKTSSLQKNTTWTNINKKSALLLNKAMSDGCWNKTFVNVKSCFFHFVGMFVRYKFSWLPRNSIYLRNSLDELEQQE